MGYSTPAKCAAMSPREVEDARSLHPLPESFHASILEGALAGLKRAGHEVDLLDLYAEGFDPVLSAQGRRTYHDTTRNRAGLEAHIERLQVCEAIVLQFPTWCFGMPAMLKGYFDRILMPGVSIDLSDPAKVKVLLGNITKIAGFDLWPAALDGALHG